MGTQKIRLNATVPMRTQCHVTHSFKSTNIFTFFLMRLCGSGFQPKYVLWVDRGPLSKTVPMGTETCLTYLLESTYTLVWE